MMTNLDWRSRIWCHWIEYL